MGEESKISAKEGEGEFEGEKRKGNTLSDGTEKK